MTGPLPIDEIRLNFNPASLMALNVILAGMMFGIALDTRVDDFRGVARMPGAMAVGIAAQFLFLPAVTFLLTLVLQPQPSVALGMILVACCPPGNISNVLTHQAGGNVALSVSMTAISNLLAIFLMPLNVAFWAGIHPTAAPLLRSFALNPVEMIGYIVLIIGLPFVLGVSIANRWPAVSARAQRWVKRVSLAFLLAFIIGGTAANFDHFRNYIGIVLLAVFLHDAIAFAIGYGCAQASRLDEFNRRAVSFEVGIRNSGLGLGIIFSFFDGLGGMAVVAGWWGIWDIIAGLALAQWWSRRSLAGSGRAPRA